MTDLYDIPLTTIDGERVSLADYKGKVVLVVNVASKCGLTPQYEQLESLYEAQKEKGLVVLGFPSNEFAGQEPGSDGEIQEFCTSVYGVEFPMFSKVCVNGEQRHPLYKKMIDEQPKAHQVQDSLLKSRLAENKLLPANEQDVMWNFEKFLIGRDGHVVGRYAPDMTVDNPVLADAIEQQLHSA